MKLGYIKKMTALMCVGGALLLATDATAAPRRHRPNRGPSGLISQVPEGGGSVALLGLGLGGVLLTRRFFKKN